MGELSNRGVASPAAFGHLLRVAAISEAPAKLNLSLAVVGRRADGFHDLVSVVAPIDLRDELGFSPGGAADRLACDEPAVPTDGRNLVLRAAAAFRRRVPAAPCGEWRLAKRIPHGAGLGGGSSDAAAALRLLNEACGRPLGLPALSEVAAEIGSDCPLFLEPRPCILRGRGERVEALPAALAASMRGRPLILAKPAWGVSTPDAYRWKAELGDYESPEAAEAGLAAALAQPDPLAALVALGNGLTTAVGTHHPSLLVALDALSGRLGLPAGMTGSGSACFALAKEDGDLESVRSLLTSAWGEGFWVARAAFL